MIHWIKKIKVRITDKEPEQKKVLEKVQEVKKSIKKK